MDVQVAEQDSRMQKRPSRVDTPSCFLDSETRKYDRLGEQTAEGRKLPLPSQRTLEHATGRAITAAGDQANSRTNSNPPFPIHMFVAQLSAACVVPSTSKRSDLIFVLLGNWNACKDTRFRNSIRNSAQPSSPKPFASIIPRSVPAVVGQHRPRAGFRKPRL